MWTSIKQCRNTSCPSQDSRYIFGCSERMLIPVHQCLSYQPGPFKVDWFLVVSTVLAIAFGISLGTQLSLSL